MNINAVTNAVPYLRKGLLFVCLVLPWLNPFASRPSVVVYPLVMCWVLAALLSLSVLTLPFLHQPMRRSNKLVLALVLVAVFFSVLVVPQEINHARTMGLLGTLTCIALMTRVGLQVALHENQMVVCVTLAWLVSASLSSMMGVLQYLGVVDHLAPWISLTATGTASANLMQRNLLATLISIGLVSGFALIAWRSNQGRMNVGEMSLAFMGLNLLAAGLASTASRAGVLEWATLCPLAAVWAWRACRDKAGSQRALFVTALLGLPLLFIWGLAMPWLLEQMSGETGANLILRVTDRANDYNACNARTALWPNMLTLIGKHPWIGWGWGETHYAHFITPYEGLRFCDYPDNAHNLFLHLAVEMGLPLTVTLFALATMWVWRRKFWLEKDIWRTMAWGLLLTIGLHSMVEFPLWSGPFQMVAGLSLGLVWCQMSTQQTGLPSPVERTSSIANQLGVMTAGIAFFLGSCYTIWDFNRVAQLYIAPNLREAAYSDDPVKHAMESWLFRHHAEFGKLSLLKVTPENAKEVMEMAERVAHHSPEPRVIKRWIQSAKFMGDEALAQTLSERLKESSKHLPPDKIGE